MAENGFIYFENPEEIGQQPKCLIKHEKWDALELQNFHWKRNNMKTLVCHDFRGGYLQYENLSMPYEG
jgi:hypothetical protein